LCVEGCERVRHVLLGGAVSHGCIVPCPAGMSRGWKKEIFLCGRVDGVGCRGIIGA
jgi:hypothetical protein